MQNLKCKTQKSKCKTRNSKVKSHASEPGGLLCIWPLSLRCQKIHQISVFRDSKTLRLESKLGSVQGYLLFLGAFHMCLKHQYWPPLVVWYFTLSHTHRCWKAKGSVLETDVPRTAKDPVRFDQRWKEFGRHRKRLLKLNLPFGNKFLWAAWYFLSGLQLKQSPTPAHGFDFWWMISLPKLSSKRESNRFANCGHF